MPARKHRRKSKHKPRPPAPPLPHELRHAAVTAGDPFLFFQALVASPPGEVEPEEEFRKLLMLIEARSVADPHSFAGEMLRRGTAMISFLGLRIMYFIEHRLTQLDRANRYQRTAAMPEDIFNVFLPRLLDIQRHLGEFTLLEASIERVRQLGRAKRIECDRADPDSSPPRKRRRTKKPTHAPPTNGHPTATHNGKVAAGRPSTNRIAALLG